MATEHDPYGPYAEPKRRMSTGTKILLILLAVAGGVMLLCCGAVVYIGMSFTEETSPQAVREVTSEIAEIEIPERFEPQGAFRGDMLFGRMKAAWYAPEQAKGHLMLTEINVRFGDPDQIREQMRTQIRQGGEERRELRIEKTETRQFTIRGEEVDFTFAEAVDPGTKEEYRLVHGSFPGREGVAILSLQIEKQAYDEAEIVEMIKSIE